MSRQRYAAALRVHQDFINADPHIQHPPIPRWAKLLIAKGHIAEDDYYAQEAEELEQLNQKLAALRRCDCGHVLSEGHTLCVRCLKEHPL